MRDCDGSAASGRWSDLSNGQRSKFRERIANRKFWVPQPGMACSASRRKVRIMKQNQEMLRRSQALRRNMTKEERHLWYDFLKDYPVQFKRQVPFENYITDFYCFRAKLVVELDGSQHYEPEEIAYDQKRTEYLESLGLSVLRISNLDVLQRFRAVCEMIDFAVKERLP